MQWLADKIAERKSQELVRTLKPEPSGVDFCSNNYLGYGNYHSIPEVSVQFQSLLKNGSSGSRLLSGNSLFAEELEKELSTFFHAGSATFYGSGYTANVGLWQCLGGKNDTFILDELVHASIIDGARLSHAKRFKFKHNDVADLERKIQNATGNIFVGIESLYSMDGDFAPLEEVAELCLKYQAHLIVDEAHAAGIYGPNGQGLVVERELENLTFARIVTFGKAFGTHGAVILGTQELQPYLLNYSRALIYSTAPAPVQLAAVAHALQWVNQAHVARKKLAKNIAFFKEQIAQSSALGWLQSQSAIQGYVIPGNEAVTRLANDIMQHGITVYPIKSPTVPAGKERIRICIHAHNTEEQLLKLIKIIENH